MAQVDEAVDVINDVQNAIVSVKQFENQFINSFLKFPHSVGGCFRGKWEIECRKKEESWRGNHSEQLGMEKQIFVRDN